MEYPFDQFGSALLAMLLPSFLCACLMSEHGKLSRPFLRVRSTEQKHQCVIKMILLLNPNHSIVPATGKKIDFIPVRTRAASGISEVLARLNFVAKEHQ